MSTQRIITRTASRLSRLAAGGCTWIIILAFAGCAAPRPAAALTTTSQPSVQPHSPSAGTASSAGSGAASERVLTADDLKGLAWRCIGPANMGGRVADIALAPGNPKTFFVAYGTGGLWKTTNNGTTFTPVFDKEDTASIGSVAVADAPADWPGWKDEKSDESVTPKPLAERGRGRIVWVGTGEGNGRNSSSWGCGVYRSTDGGEKFRSVGLRDTHDIPRLAVDPRNPDVCYVAALGHLWGANAERGVFKTSDGGRTWQHVLKIDDATGACEVILDPSNPDTVYAAMYMRRRTAWSFRSGGPEGGIYKSTDGGMNWKKLTKGLPPQTGRIGLDIFRGDPRILYAIIESDVGGWGVDVWDNRHKTGGLFRSDDAGDSWTRVNAMNFRPFYFSKVRVDPTDAERVYVLGYGLSVSDDGGKTLRAGGARLPHGDLHAMVIDPSDRDRMYLGTDGGLYLTYDRGKTWDFLNHLATGEFYNVGVDHSDPYRVAGGLQDNCSWFGPSATQWSGEPMTPDDPDAGGGITNQDWRFIFGGDGFHVAFDPIDSNIVYAESQGGELVRVRIDNGRARRIKPSPKEGQPRFRFNWNSPFFISPHNPTTLYFGGNYVFKLTDRGDKWERISPDLSTRDVEKIETVGSEAETHGTVVSLAESPLKAGMIWAGTDDGLVHVTQDDGKTWKIVTPPETKGRYISRIEASHHDAGTAYVAIDGHRNDDFQPHLFMTTDAGATWVPITGDPALPADRRLPDHDIVKVVREDRANGNVLYVGSERAAWISIDRGRSWTKMNGESLPTVAVDDIVQHPRDRDLVLGTHGRSIYILDDASHLSQLTPEIVREELHLFDVQPAKPRLFIPYGGLWSNRMFIARNPPMGARISYWLRDHTNEPVKLVITDVKDHVVRELTGTNWRGLNRVIWDLQPQKHDRFDNPDAILGQTQFVPPGEYTLTLKCGERSATTKLTVLPPPPDTGPAR